VVPEQQVEASGWHSVPTGSHCGGAWQVKPPSDGRHSWPLQHWSLNWHWAPALMQQGASPV
jgi:hypothetical protein